MDDFTITGVHPSRINNGSLQMATLVENKVEIVFIPRLLELNYECTPLSALYFSFKLKMKSFTRENNIAQFSIMLLWYCKIMHIWPPFTTIFYTIPSLIPCEHFWWFYRGNSYCLNCFQALSYNLIA